MTLADPSDYRAVWDRKPELRAVYRDIFRRVMAAATPGLVVELGGGSGNFKAFAPELVSTDVIAVPWLDLVCDAQRMPFADGTVSSVVMVDTLHHVENPLFALREIARVLKPGGRLVFCEPAITPLSGLFYRRFHREPVDMSVDPLHTAAITADKDPYDSNQAIPTLLVGRHRAALAQALPELALRSVDWFSFLAYPLSGGFQPWSMLPGALAAPLLALEWSVHRLFGRLAGFRLLAVYEKRADGA